MTVMAGILAPRAALCHDRKADLAPLLVELTSELCRGLIPATKNRGDYSGTSGVAISLLVRMTIATREGRPGAGAWDGLLSI